MKKAYLELLENCLGKDVKILHTLQGGMMNESSVVLSNGKKYVFYAPTEQANEMVDREIEKETQLIAEQLGVTRKTKNFDVQTGVKILDFIEGNSLNHLEDFDYKKVAELMHKFHSSKVKASKDYLPLKRLQNFKEEASQFVKNFDEGFYELFDYVFSNRNYLENQDKTLAHNDAQRSNIIESENGEYFLIDFEFAMNNDPVYDLATFGNDDVKEGLKLVEEYKKINPLVDIEKRYALWRIDVSLQWYLVAIIKHYRGEGATHKIDFLAVANHFLENAKEARKLLK